VEKLIVLLRHSFILTANLTFISSIGLLPADYTMLHTVPMLYCFFSLTSDLTDKAVNTKPFLRPHKNKTSKVCITYVNLRRVHDNIVAVEKQ